MLRRTFLQLIGITPALPLMPNKEEFKIGDEVTAKLKNGREVRGFITGIRLHNEKDLPEIDMQIYYYVKDNGDRIEFSTGWQYIVRLFKKDRLTKVG